MGQVALSEHSVSELPSVATVWAVTFAQTCPVGGLYSGRVSSYDCLMGMLCR
jgi:hypothetical protein